MKISLIFIFCLKLKGRKSCGFVMIFLKDVPFFGSAIRKARKLPQLSLGEIGTHAASSRG
jgi:hypothetical protein